MALNHSRKEYFKLETTLLFHRGAEQTNKHCRAYSSTRQAQRVAILRHSHERDSLIGSELWRRKLQRHAVLRDLLAGAEGAHNSTEGVQEYVPVDLLIHEVRGSGRGHPAD